LFTAYAKQNALRLAVSPKAPAVNTYFGRFPTVLTSMSFVTTQPEALLYAAGKLQIFGSAMAAESAAIAAPTTGVVPATADEVSALQAAIFAAYGSLYQSVNAQATTNHELFVHTLGTSAHSYTATESVNSAATASRGISGLPSSAANAASADPPGDALANIVDIGTGNWSSASSDLLGMCGGGLLVKSGQGLTSAGGVVPDAAVTVPTGVVSPVGSAGSGGVPMFAGLGHAASVGKLSVPPTWAAGAVPASEGPGAVTTAGWTTPAPQSAPVTTMPAAMPTMATAGKGLGFGGPRYGFKPTVMPKSVVV
jgi:PPE-repeat protein